ncbi:MAG: protein translocase subunit SecD [Gemmatimonadetes bacterium]|nr:MAG: protein translocase subunit SecD [Gemmatimonadota bacterium]
MSTIRGRLITIVVLLALSAWALVPKNRTERVPDAVTGRMKDTTVRRVPINLGLDLRGGVHLALEVDQSKGPVPDCADAIQRAERVVRTRIDEFGTTEPVVQIVGRCRLIVELPGEKDVNRAKGIVQRTAFLEFRITDMNNVFLEAIPAIDVALRAAGVRGPAAGPSNAVARLLGQDTTKAAGRADTSNQRGALESFLSQGTLAGEYLVRPEQFEIVDSLINRPEVKRLIPRGVALFWGTQLVPQRDRSYNALYAVEDRPIITGECLTKAQPRRDPLTNQSVVAFTLTHRCGRIFGDATARHVGHYMAIILDGRVQGQPPVIKSEIRNEGQIELGSRPFADAQDLALVLRAGALPAPLTIVEERTISASLGEDSIHAGVRAGVVGIILVVLIMVGYYRLSGALAVAALALYTLFTFGGLAAFGFTLTMPGLAGFVLSVGIAVDANVLIFERIREELQHGKLVRTAVDEGFKHAMSAIIDSNVSTALTAFILYLVGTGPVQGFAITLIIGIAASMVTAVYVVRTFYMVWLQRRPDLVTLSV